MCDCIKRVNAKLADYNGVLETNLLANPQRVVLSTTKITSRGKRPPIFEASYCPFCGEKYKEKKRRSLAAAGAGATP